MQMNQRCGGRFHHQRVSCRSDFKETRRVEFLFKSYNSLTFAWQRLLPDDVFTIKRLFDFFFFFDTKLLPKARGVSPVQTVINT